MEYGLDDRDIARMKALTEPECDAISRSEESEELAAWVKTLDPELLRNVFGRWVRHGARYVYPWHKVPEMELYYCALGPLSSRDGRLPVATTMAARVALLPKHPPELRFPRQWRVSMAFDLGTVDAWAGVAMAWSKTYPQAFELETRKATGLGDDEMFDRMADMIDEVEALDGIELTTLRGDLAGIRKGTEKTWDGRIRRRWPRLANTGIQSAPKRRKEPRIRQHWLDMMMRRYRFIAGGPLDFEGRNLRYKKDKPADIHKHRKVRIGGKEEMPGDHAHDACLYAVDPIPPNCKELDVQLYTRPQYFQHEIH
jgi:hypothetical protein